VATLRTRVRGLRPQTQCMLRSQRGGGAPCACDDETCKLRTAPRRGLRQPPLAPTTASHAFVLTPARAFHSHIDQTKKHEILIRNELPATESTLKQINSQLTADVEKMRTKEKYVNTTFSSLAEEYTRVKETLVGVESEHSTASGAVGNLTQDLAVIADQLSEIKGTMDSRGSSMTDTTPLVKIRTALQDIKVEINHFELRIGVVGHTLLAAQTRGSKEGEEGEAGVVGEDGDSDDGGEFE